MHHERLSNPVLTEIQSIIRSYMERTWLPVFLATPEFTERRKLKVDMRLHSQCS